MCGTGQAPPRLTESWAEPGHEEQREQGIEGEEEKNAKEYLLTNIYVAEKKGEFWLKTEAEKRQLGSQHILETASPL